MPKFMMTLTISSPRRGEMTTIYYDKDADLSVLNGKVVAVLGYGNQGRAQALNMRDSGCKVIIGNRKDAYYQNAKNDGLEVFEIPEAVKRADVICLLLPDEVHAKTFKEEIMPNLAKSKTLDFASGFTIFSKAVIPPKDTDVVMVAPKMIGEGVRELYVKGLGAPAILGVERDATGNAWKTALAIAKAIGATRAGAVKSTFEEEAVTDLFNEQTVAFVLLLKNAFQILTKAGYDPVVTQLELYGSGEWREIVQAILKYGLFEQGKLHSTTSQYGQLSRGSRIVNAATRKQMKRTLSEIRSGKFAKEWLKDIEAGYPKLNKLRSKAIDQNLARTEREVRERIRLPPIG
jgi:ketol-acid reductoisomerase